ncbi:MAG: RNA pyrophosphohydrolase [Legionellaceae bacterium]|nr:RNA pyrophosphohydrolase [Legionellaceae bacterium]
MVVDRGGYRLNVGIVLINDLGEVFWGKRAGNDSWQFPQGGLATGETALEAMYRELHEEVGLLPADVQVLGVTRRWLKYRLPKQYVRHSVSPLVIGQKQKWFLLRLLSPEHHVCLERSNTPEFDNWRWIEYNAPIETVIFFKKQVYTRALHELEGLLKRQKRRRP